MKKTASIIIVPLFLLIFSTASFSAKSSVYVLTIQGVINPVSAEYIQRGIDLANAERASALVIELDTPGGLDTSMRKIIKSINQSAVPVVVYVFPSGARAASAGVFITMAAHVAAMAPGTNIGAAHPVGIGIGGKMDKTMVEKVTNDAVAYIKSIAERRGRNKKWAEKAVRKSVSITAREALKLRVIDLIAKDLDDLMKKIDGKTVETVSGKVKLKTRGVPTKRVPMGLRLKILSIIGNPNVAYILMLLGFYGLFFELTLSLIHI